MANELSICSAYYRSCHSQFFYFHCQITGLLFPKNFQIMVFYQLASYRLVPELINLSAVCQTYGYLNLLATKVN